MFLPETGRVTDGVAGPGPVIMAGEILPAEIPREASIYFNPVLRPYLPQIAAADWRSDFGGIRLPPEIKRAVILYHGHLTPDYQYLQKYLK
jgi:alpha-aminoadipic semialdehyde synthase